MKNASPFHSLDQGIYGVVCAIACDAEADASRFLRTFVLNPSFKGEFVLVLDFDRLGFLGFCHLKISAGNIGDCTRRTMTNLV